MSNQQLYLCPAPDTVNGRPLTLPERYSLAKSKMRGENSRKGGDLANELELGIGMKVMVTENMETDLDVANGSQGVIVNIILDADEPPIPNDPVVRTENATRLHRVEARPDTGNKTRRARRADNTFGTKIRIQLACGTKTVTCTTTRQQFAITPAYAFTDYRS
jgi:hypothetical protein